MRAFPAVPRWTLEPVPGAAEYEARIPGGLATALRSLASELSVPLSALLLTAHAKVLGALAGEHEVCTGYAHAGVPRPCRLVLAGRTWRELLVGIARAEAELLSRRGADPGAQSLETVALETVAFETVFDPQFELAARGGELGSGIVLCVTFAERDGLVLRLRYRTDVLDAEIAARIAGYHIQALALIAAAPDAEHARRSVLSAEEKRFQLHGLAGPQRELPDQRVHERFEERVRLHPDAIAAVHGDQRCTYGELNRRANRLARALLARGLPREGVVAVVSERNLEWLAAVLAIWKAGGAYLPIEPHFPPERIAQVLARAGCRLVLAEPSSTGTLDQALGRSAGIRRLLLDAAGEAGRTDFNPGVRVAPNQLAYVFFTSGSTGEPKGAMCEHAGMFNHLLAKIDDLGIGAGTVVAQTAPQCFDISLWQLLSALLVGGRTLLVEQTAILDSKRFVDRIVAGRVNVLQVVPSYLEVVLSCLKEHPRELPDLRCVSVTGEALKKELAERWFAARPGIKLVNAYGLTETSDDTNHEIMACAPRRERVPLGRPIQNVHVYVVDEHLQPVPLGAPGEIVFSGVCVGRGYINDPERTQRNFMADPYRPGQRLYRSGDYGRWLPEGKLEFLGRRDAQVKVSGFRIELGEIENALLRLRGVREVAVVVAERAGRDQRLAAFYSGERPLDADALREQLRALLPAYMVPHALHWREKLPLTGNGKVDRKALLVLAAQLEFAASRGRPATATEQRLATAWSEVLDVPKDQIGRGASFFDLGGTSLSAIRLATRLGRAVTLKDLNDHPVLADLAALIDGRLDRQAATEAVP